MQICKPHAPLMSKGDKFSLKHCPLGEIELKYMQDIPPILNRDKFSLKYYRKGEIESEYIQDIPYAYVVKNLMYA